jgi:peroxiredoxin Q/BCP
MTSPKPKKNKVTKAPVFSLVDQDGKVHKLSDYKGQWVLLYFYPKDNTTGCTVEACAITEEFANFQKLKVKVLGVSIDSVASHKKFAEKYNLPFTLLADVDKKVVQKYKVWAEKSMYGRKYMGTLRTSFLIDPKGKIVKIYEKVKPALHAGEVLEDLKELQKKK